MEPCQTANSGKNTAIADVSTKNAYLRPQFHFLAPHGWMNDPCAPGYDASTKLYHLFYQWNPDDCEWGNISWGHAVSRDLITWTYSDKRPALVPDKPYDCKGVFTGCFVPSGLYGEKEQLTVLYTSVNHLPIHWTIPYVRGSEGLSVALSKDGGKSWMKSSRNPVLSEEPPGLHVTGWRDPFLSEWPALDRLRGKEDVDKSLYGLVSGGVHGSGPTTFLYTIDSEDLTKWTYVGPLIQFGLNFRPCKRWSGDFGTNLECTNFMTLSHVEHSRHFLITGTEGGSERDWVEKGYTSGSIPRRVPRYCLWFAGSLSCTPDGTEIRMEHDFGGFLDHGIFYATNSFHDPFKNRRVLWGWLVEEDMPIAFHKAKGWNGSLALPREAFLNVITNVVGALISPISEIGSIRPVTGTDGNLSLHTLGIQPIPELATLRSGEPYVVQNQANQSYHWTLPIPVRSRHFEISATISVEADSERVGFVFRQSKDLATSGSVFFLPKLEEIVVDRSTSNVFPDCNRCDEKGAFTLFRKLESKGVEKLEKLALRIFVDNDIVEVFANNRFALSTMVYIRNEDALGINFVADAPEGSVVIENLAIWELHGAVVK